MTEEVCFNAKIILRIESKTFTRPYRGLSIFTYSLNLKNLLGRALMDEHIKSVKAFYDILRWSGVDVGSAWSEAELDRRIAFLLRKCGPNKDLPLLDIGCGNGRYSVALAKAGYQVVGVDFDEKSIEDARKLAAEQNVTVDFVCADISEADLKPGLGLAFSVQCFQHLRDAQRDACLRRIKELLVWNGKLFAEMPYHKAHEERHSGRDEWDGYIQLYKGRYDPESEENICEMTFIRKSDEAERKVTTRRKSYSPSEIRELLKREGFEKIRIYGDWDGREITEECCRMIFIAQKCSR